MQARVAVTGPAGQWGPQAPSNISIFTGNLSVYPGQGHAGSLVGGWLQSLARARGAGLVREAELEVFEQTRSESHKS